MNGIIWIFTISVWHTCAKTCKSGVQWYTNQVCISTARENTRDPKRAVTLLCSPPALSQWPVQFELSVLFIRCSHNCHLYCDECYTRSNFMCFLGFSVESFLCFGSMVDLEFVLSGNFSFVVKQGKNFKQSLYLSIWNKDTEYANWDWKCMP